MRVLTNTCAPTRPTAAPAARRRRSSWSGCATSPPIETGIDRIADQTPQPDRAERSCRIAPHSAPIYDNGEYEEAMDTARRAFGLEGVQAKRRASRSKRGKLRGIGLANYIECTMGYPREWSKITVKPDGEVEVAIGTLSSGQGHETSFAQCVSEWFGVPFESVRLVQGDTDIVPVGGGSHSGRSMRMAGFVMGTCSNTIIARAKRIAAHMLEVDPDTVEFKDGRFRSHSSERSFDVFEIARAAQSLNDLDDELRGPLAAEMRPAPSRTAVIPTAARSARSRSTRHRRDRKSSAIAAVDDVGRAVNPMILHGQTHGAIAQGVGQALWEHCMVDADSGQVMTGSFMDYAMPRSDMLPTFKTELMEVPSPSNPLGVRAGGEGGTTPALGRRDQCHRRRAEATMASPTWTCRRHPNVSGALSRMASTRNPRTFGA